MKQEKKPSGFFPRLWKVIKTTFKTFLLMGILAGILVMGLGTYILYELIQTAPPLDVSKIYATESTMIYDKDGNLISEFGIEKREWISYDEVSPVLIDAFVAVEDSNFFEHPGVDFKRLLVALVTNVLSGDDQGASTLTQQLIKQTHLTSDKTIKRKIQEMYLALQIEQVLTKEQILEAYLNYSPFGGGIYGVEKASQYYFGTSASQLTLAQAATLAGLVQRPEGYRPDFYPDLAEYRRDLVLKLMVRHGYITEELAQLASAEPITDLLVYKKIEIDEREKYQSFIDAVLTEVEEKYGLDPRSGLQIYTTMDATAQSLVYDLQHPTLSKDYNLVWPTEMQSGIVFMDTQTGEVRAIGGGYDEENLQRSYNLATQLKRQPGSTAKPIFAFGPAIEYLKWGTGTTVDDELYTYQNGSGQIIHNYNNEYSGRMTIRHALNKSLNVPAVKAFNAVGVKDVQAFAEGLGFVFKEALYESAAIGGVSEGFSPLLMAGAYATFGNGGIYNEPITITKIVKSDGTVIQAEQDSHRAMSEETAYLMTDMLHTVMTQGTGTAANVEGMYLSGKTGTTNFDPATTEKHNLPSNAIQDSWFVGFSSDYTAAIWTGYDNSAKGQYINSQTQGMPWRVFNRLMSRLNTAGDTPPERPATIQSVEIEQESGAKDGEVQLPSKFTPNNYRVTELFVAGYGPTEVSTRFSQLETPQNFKGEFKDGVLTFSWDHISTYTLGEEELQSQIKTAKNYATNAFNISEVPTLNPTESQLRMMLKQLQTVGQTLYEVYAVDYKGKSTLIGTTTQSSIQLDELSLKDLSSFESYYLQARYEHFESSRSEPTDEIQVTCDDCSKPVELPKMKGWTREKVEEWAHKNKVQVEFVEESTTDEETGIVLYTTPESGRLTPQDTLVVTIAKKELVVPNYSKQSKFLSLYEVWASDHDIELVVKEEYHPTIKAGELIRVNPGIGQVIQPNEKLTLTISKGQAPKEETPLPPTEGSNGDSSSSETEDSSEEEIPSESHR